MGAYLSPQPRSVDKEAKVQRFQPLHTTTYFEYSSNRIKSIKPHREGINVIHVAPTSGRVFLGITRAFVWRKLPKNNQDKSFGTL